MVQGGICQGSTVAFAFLHLALFEWGGVGAVVGFCGTGGDEIRPQWVAWGLILPGALAVGPVDQGTT